MILNDYKSNIAQQIADYYEIDMETITDSFSKPPNSKLGDISFACFNITKQKKQPPVAISAEIVEKIGFSGFREVKMVGPYVNFFVDQTDYTEKLMNKSIIPNIWDKRVIVEYMNANPNKPLHIWQARNVCIGDSIAKVFKALWYTAHAVNYGDDSGVNVWYNILWHMKYDYPIDTNKKFDHYCGDIYTTMRKKDDDPGFKKSLSEILQKIEKWDDPAISKMHYEYTRKCAIAQFQSCWDINSYFDLVNWETDILQMDFFTMAMEKLKDKWYVKYIEEGEAAWCWIIDLAELPEFQKLDKQYQVLVKSDGVATYVGKDIAYSMWKLGYLSKDFYYEKLVTQPNGADTISTTSAPDGKQYDFGNYDKAIAVIDDRQSFAQNVVKGSLDLLGYLDGDKDYIHLAYGVVYMTPVTLMKFWFELTEEEKAKAYLPFSSRKWWSVTIDDTMKLLYKKAYAETKWRHSDQSEEWIKDTANKIAVGAFRYFLISSGEQKEIVFDIDAAMALEGETWPYIMYGYARICNILNKYDGDLENLEIDYSSLNHEAEFEIIKKIDSLEEVLQETIKELSPNKIAKYLFETAQLFNNYYAKVKILAEEGTVLTSKLALLKKLQDMLNQAMGLIGIEVVEKM